MTNTEREKLNCGQKAIFLNLTLKMKCRKLFSFNYLAFLEEHTMLSLVTRVFCVKGVNVCDGYKIGIISPNACCLTGFTMIKLILE